MNAESQADAAPRVNMFTAGDVETILHERGWLEAQERGTKSPASPSAPLRTSGEAGYSSDLLAWIADAAALLGPQAETREALADLLGLIFHYDAAELLAWPQNHSVLAREGAREVLRGLAHLVLDGGEIDSDHYKGIIAALKEKLEFRGRELFHPIRLALAGRAGEGGLDRVILLLDRAARLPFAAPVKGTRQRVLEFCAALD
jgi:hypothetical protein